MLKVDKPQKISAPRLDIKQGRIDMTHGSGGRRMAQLIEQLFLPAFSNPYLEQREDQARFAVASGLMVMTTDSYVISPLFFPGGDIGCLAVHGTVNDIAMSGAKPLYLSASFILEEGFPLADLKKIVDSMAQAAQKAQVAIVTGDTKVVERGKGDGIFINTTGLGEIPQGVHLSGNTIQPGDHVLLSGYIGDHGVAIMAHRHHLQFSTTLQSDTAALYELVESMLHSGAQIRCLRDPTRGGIATTLNEWAKQSQVGFYIEEGQIPVREEVASACELLGLDPLYIANEGKLLAICSPEHSKQLLQSMRLHPLGKDAQIIGHATNDSRNFVQLKTKFGGMRIMDWLVGEQLPRIC